jgi:hypothetical protein
VSISTETQIKAELFIGVLCVWGILIYVGVYGFGVLGTSAWDGAVTLLTTWIIADKIEKRIERKTEGKFSVPSQIPFIGNKPLPLPHRITVAYFAYPIGILLATFFGDVIAGALLSILSWLQEIGKQTYSLLGLIPIGSNSRHTEYVFLVSAVVSFLVYVDFRTRSQTEKQTTQS